MGFKCDSGLVLYLPFYELYGSSFMSKDAYGHLCTVTGALWTPRGRDFDGTDDKIVLNDNLASSPLNFQSSDFTVEMWVQFISKTGIRSLFCRGLWGVDGFFFDLRGTNNLWFAFGSGYTGYTVSGFFTDTAIGDFVHLAFTKCGTILTGYNNLVPTTIATNAPNPASCARSTRFGIYETDINPFAGLMGEARAYNRALTPLEIQRNYLATKWRYQ